MITKIYNHLKTNNLNPYFVGQHQGLCRKNYVVVKEGSQIPTLHSNKLGQKRVDIIIYTPKASYVNLIQYANKVRDDLKSLEYLRKTGYESPTIVDGDKEAYTMSIEYVLQKILEG